MKKSIGVTVVLAGIFAVLVFVKGAIAASKSSENQDIYLSPCQSAANCVVSINTDAKPTATITPPKSFIAPIVYRSDLATARSTLLRILTVVPSTQVIEQTDNYIHAQSKNRFGSVDELEFLFAEDQLIYLRSASNNLPFDFGLNRRRLEQIRLAMQDLNA